MSRRISVAPEQDHSRRHRCQVVCRCRRLRSAVAADPSPRRRHPQRPRLRGVLLTSEPSRPTATPPTRSDAPSISGGPAKGLAETPPYVSLPLHHRSPHLPPLQPARATRSSTPASADSRTTSSNSSAPHTPLFPASSADFLLFPSHPLYRGGLTTRNHSSPSSAVSLLHGDTCEPSQLELSRLRSAAFSELRRSVQENGEGFVKRMREFEDSRSKSAQHSQARGIEKRRRKRYSPSVPTTRATRKSTKSDDDDDVLIFSSTFGNEPFLPKQKRSSSLGAMDDSDFQLHGKTDSFGRLSPISSIFHSIPFARYASHVHPNTTNQPTELSTSFSTSFDFKNPLHTNAFKPVLSHSSSHSLASSADVSLSSSSAEDANYSSSSLVVSPPQSPSHPSAGAVFPPAPSAEKAIAAITLDMANGAGGLGDYEAVRALDVSSADELQAGELWH